MKKTLILIALVILTGCRVEDNNAYCFTLKFKDTYFLENGLYYYEFDNSIYKMDFTNNQKIMCDNCYLKNENDNIVLYINESNSNEILGTLEKDERELKKYLICKLYDNGRDYYSLEYNKNELIKFPIATNNYTVVHNYYIKDGILYFIDMQWEDVHRNNGIAGNHWDDNYVGSNIYCIDLKDYSYKLIYSSDNQYTIIYGNEDVAYLIDKNNSIYRKDLHNNDLKLCYETDYVGEISTEYRHGKIFVFEDEVNIIDVEY